MGSQDRVNADVEEEVNYLNNQGGFEAMAKGIKVRTIMIILVIKIRSKEIGGTIMIGAGFMSLLEIVRLLQQVL